MNPKLRPVEVRPFVDRGRPALMLRDPLALNDQVAILPQALGPLLALMDGTRDVSGLHASLLVRAGIRIAPEVIQQVIHQLDDVLLLENQRFAQAYAETLHAFRSAPFRPPSLAGPGYPADPAVLARLLDEYLAVVSVNGAGPTSGWPDVGTRVAAASAPGPAGDVVGLVSPHIDYQRGGPVYAGVWGSVAGAARSAELAIILGTDHSGGPGRITLTRQHYATPYGVLPTHREMVEALAVAIGGEAPFDEEIHHRREHSIELAAVWLHHVRGGEPCPVLPILCGSFQPFVSGQADPAADAGLNAALDVLRSILGSRRALVIAAADLAHIGPAFGDARPVDPIRYAQLKAADEVLIQTITAGDADAFFRTIAAEGDRRNICGLPPIYLTLRLLGGLEGRVHGELTGYGRCPADAANTSFVSVCGVAFRSS